METSILVSVAVFAFVGIIFLVIIFSYRKKLKRISMQNVDFSSNNFPFSIPLVASFWGLKFLPKSIAFGYNNLNPRLQIFSEAMEYKVIFGRRKEYQEVEMVDVWTAPGTKNVVFRFRNSPFTFVGNVYNENNLKGLLKFVEQKGCSLSSEAKTFLGSQIM